MDEVVGIIVGIATIYFLWKNNELSKEQNQIFREQNDIFRREKTGQPMAPTPRPLTGLRRYWPMLGMAGLAVATWLAVGYDIYDRHSDPTLHRFVRGSHFQSVVGCEYTNQLVPLDGFEYSKCRLEHVTFVYNGTAGFSFHDNAIVGKTLFQTDNEGIIDFAVLLKGLGFLPGDFSIASGPGRNPALAQPPKRVP
jgi:hypothetical protein